MASLGALLRSRSGSCTLDGSPVSSSNMMMRASKHPVHQPGPLWRTRGCCMLGQVGQVSPRRPRTRGRRLQAFRQVCCLYVCQVEVAQQRGQRGALWGSCIHQKKDYVICSRVMFFYPTPQHLHVQYSTTMSHYIRYLWDACILLKPLPIHLQQRVLQMVPQ